MRKKKRNPLVEIVDTIVDGIVTIVTIILTIPYLIVNAIFAIF